MSSPRSTRLRAARRTVRAGFARWLVLALVLGMALALVRMVGASPPAVAAAEPCFLDQGGAVSCSEPGAEVAPAPAPPSLVREDAYAKMTSGQAAAMRRFEGKAVEAVLLLHGLPPQDAASVRFWARDEALGLLQTMVIRAVNTPVPERSADQQQVADWIGDLFIARTRPGVLQAGAEYTMWAGLSLNRYWELVNGGASKAELTAFLSQTPKNYSGSTPSTSTSGFCKYVSPAPYADEYVGRTSQLCVTPCTASLYVECSYPRPALDEFLRWGEARLSGTDGSVSREVTLTAATMALAASVSGSLSMKALLGAPDGVNKVGTLIRLLVSVPKVDTTEIAAARDTHGVA